MRNPVGDQDLEQSQRHVRLSALCDEICVHEP